MRLSLVCLGVAMVFTACGPARGVSNFDRDPGLEVRSPGEIRIYTRSVPRCGYRELRTVVGRSYGELRAAAFRLQAHAVIVEPRRYHRVGVEGTAVRFTSSRCKY
ncbi:MAG TPA: hypothetical protein VHG08_06475 [Longimicrobium sp.]|nr:hypothetical protein [Longimicrobium sp.]